MTTPSGEEMNPLASQSEYDSIRWITILHSRILHWELQKVLRGSFMGLYHSVHASQRLQRLSRADCIRASHIRHNGRISAQQHALQAPVRRLCTVYSELAQSALFNSTESAWRSTSVEIIRTGTSRTALLKSFPLSFQHLIKF